MPTEGRGSRERFFSRRLAAYFVNTHHARNVCDTARVIQRARCTHASVSSSRSKRNETKRSLVVHKLKRSVRAIGETPFSRSPPGAFARIARCSARHANANPACVTSGPPSSTAFRIAFAGARTRRRSRRVRALTPFLAPPGPPPPPPPPSLRPPPGAPRDVIESPKPCAVAAPRVSRLSLGASPRRYRPPSRCPVPGMAPRPAWVKRSVSRTSYRSNVEREARVKSDDGKSP